MYRLIVNTNLPASITDTVDSRMDNWVELDLGNATIALTYQANDLAELKSREVNRSNRIKLPRTSVNNAVFGIPSEPLSATIAPYRYFDCRLYDDGVELFGTGAKLQLMDTTNTTYEVCIKGSLFDFFDKLKELSLRDLATTAYDTGKPKEKQLSTVDWTVSNIANTDEEHTVVFPLIDWDTANNANLVFSQPNLPDNEDEDGSEVVDDEHFRIHVKSQYIFPAVKLSALMDAICMAQGYTLILPDEVVSTDPDKKYSRAVVPVSSLNPGEEKIEEVKREAWVDTSTSALAFPTLVWRKGRFFFFNPIVRSSFIKPHDKNENDACLEYRPTYSGTYAFKIKAAPRTDSPSGATLRIQHDVLDANNHKTVDNKSMDIPLDGSEVYMTYDIEQGGYLRFWVQSDSALKAELSYFSFTCVDFKPIGAVFPTGRFPVVRNLPNITQLDLFKAVCQLYGMVVSVDERKKQVTAYTFNEVVGSIGKNDFLDWSHKLDDSAHGSSYQWNSYGQKSYITYAEEEGANGEKLQDRACFTIDNSTLPAEKTLFEVPFATCEEADVCGLRMAKIRMVGEGDNSPDSITEPKPKLLYLTKKEGVKMRFTSEDGDLFNSGVLLAAFAPLTMECFITDCYSVLAKSLLQRVRVLKEKLYLTPLDMQSFSHQKPIYFSKYGCCFYVNKVSNYQPHKLTEVELVAILP